MSKPFVVPTGGEYFFSPSIAFFKDTLARTVKPGGTVTSPHESVAEEALGSTTNPCKRGVGVMGQLLPWERSLLALIHGTSEADFKSVGILIGPIILPGLMPWPLNAIVKMALKRNYAITIENNIWFPRALDTSTIADLTWLIHESVHVVDYQVAGIGAFLKTYVQQAIVHGFKHDDIPHEKRANRIEAAAKGMLARVPDLVTAIKSCDGSAILTLLQSRKVEWQAALNASMHEQ